MAPSIDIFAHIRRHSRSSLKNQQCVRLSIIIYIHLMLSGSCSFDGRGRDDGCDWSIKNADNVFRTYHDSCHFRSSKSRWRKSQQRRCISHGVSSIDYDATVHSWSRSSLYIFSVPSVVLREAYESVETLLVEWNQQYRQDGPIARYLCQMTASLIQAQDASLWSSGSLNSLFQQLLLIPSMDDRPKVSTLWFFSLTSFRCER